MKKILYKLTEIFFIYFNKLKIFLLNILNIKILLIFKFNRRKALFPFFFFVIYLLLRKKKNTVCYYKSINIVGIKKLLKGNFNSRQKFFRYLNCYKSHCVNRSKVKSSSIKNSRISNKIFLHKKTIVINNCLALRTLRMSQCLFLKYRNKYVKFSIKKKKKHLFKIKKMIRKYGNLKTFHFKIFTIYIFWKRKELFFFNMLKYLNEFHLNFYPFTFLLYFLNSKNINFFFDKKNQFNTFFFNKYFSDISCYYNEHYNNYISPKYRNSIYRFYFRKFNYISKKHAISFIKLKCPENFKLFDTQLKKNKYGLNFLFFILYSFYVRHYIKFRSSIILTSFKRYLKKFLSFVIKNFFFLIYKFCRNNFLILNKTSFFFFDEFLIKYCKILPNFKSFYSVLKICCWRFYGVYQLETFYMYLGFFFFNELGFVKSYIYIYIYNILYRKFVVKKSCLLLKYKYFLTKNRLYFWLLYSNTPKNLHKNYLCLATKNLNFLMFYTSNILFSIFKEQRKDVRYILYLKKLNSKSLIIKYRMYLYPLYRKNLYFHGFYFMYKRNYYKTILKKKKQINIK